MRVGKQGTAFQKGDGMCKRPRGESTVHLRVQCIQSPRTVLKRTQGWNNVSDDGGLGQSLEGLARGLDFVLRAVGTVTGFSADLPLGDIILAGLYKMCKTCQQNATGCLRIFFFFFFLLHHVVCGILVPSQGLNPLPLQWKHGVLTMDHQGSPALELLNT